MSDTNTDNIDYKKLQRLIAQGMVLLLRDCSLPVAQDIEVQLLRELLDEDAEAIDSRSIFRNR